MNKGLQGLRSLFGEITPAELAKVRKDTERLTDSFIKFQKRKAPANVGSKDGEK